MAQGTSYRDYMFGYEYRASARLDLQHFLIKQQIGHLVHPSITQTLPDTGAKIADVGAGTCIWAIESSQSLHPTTQIDCFDVTAAQFPPKHWLPGNITLHTHNAFEPFPPEYQGKYDLVNIRLLVCIVKDNDPTKLIKNLVSLLKPGGSLQWTEGDIEASMAMIPPQPPSAPSTAMQKILDFMNAVGPDLQSTWVRKLDTFFETAGLTAVQLEKHAVSRHYDVFHNEIKLLACEEAVAKAPDVSDEEREGFRRTLEEAYGEMRRGGAGFNSAFVLAVGRKPMA